MRTRCPCGRSGQDRTPGSFWRGAREAHVLPQPSARQALAAPTAAAPLLILRGPSGQRRRHGPGQERAAGEASVGEGPPTFPTKEANKTLSNRPCLRTGLGPETPTLPPTLRGPPQGWCLALRECLGCHGRLKAPLCPRETQGPGRGEKSVGADGPQGRGGAGGLLGRGLLHAHLSLHAHGHQGWRKQGRAPQQHLRG